MMAWFTYHCEEHGEFRRSLKIRDKVTKCLRCDKECKSVIRIGSVQVVERLDNGAMARAVERLHNIEEIINDRADKHSEEFMKNLELDDGN